MNPKLKKLRILRKENNLTTSDMAQKLNISQSMYSYIEIGVKRLSYNIAVQIGDIFGMTPDEIFYEDFKQFFDTHDI